MASVMRPNLSAHSDNFSATQTIPSPNFSITFCMSRPAAFSGAIATVIACMDFSELFKLWITFWITMTMAPRIAMTGVVEIAMRPFCTMAIGFLSPAIEPPMF